MNEQFWRALYSRIACPLLELALPLAARRRPNLREGLEGRRGVWERLESALTRRDPAKPLIWFHVASAGEFLQAQPVMERFWRNGCECAVTFTSVNGYKWGQRATFPAGQTPIVREYLPLDTAANMQRMLAVMRPTAIVYVQYDLWPNLLWEARAACVPQFLISATIQPKSHRVASAPARSFYKSLYACLDGIFTVTDDDRRRFLSTNPTHPNIQVVGNTRFDSVLDRKKRVTPPRLPESFGGAFLFIAGSTWPPDEACIFPALRDALERQPNFAAIIAPHEPTPEHLQLIEAFFQGIPQARLTQLPPNAAPPVRLIVVDTVGVLSSLYSAATLAYVGGAFTTGVHNVMEPAAMGLPVIFGPKHYNSAEAVDLLERGAAFSVATSEEFRAALTRLLDAPETCRKLGQQAQQRIEAQAGAADRSFALIAERIPRLGGARGG